MVPAQVGHQDGVVHVLGGLEGIGKPAAHPPLVGHPVGGGIVVDDVRRGEVGAQGAVHVAGVFHHHRLDIAVVDAVLGGQVRHDQLLLLGRACGGGGVGAGAPLVARLDGHLIGGAIGQAGDGGGGGGEVAAELLEGGLVGLSDADVGGGPGHPGGQGHGGHHPGGSALPVAVNGGDLEVVGFQVVQPGDHGLIGVGGGGLAQRGGAGAVGHGVAGNVVHRAPAQGYLAVARGDGEALHLVGVIFRVFRHDVLEELNFRHSGEARLACGGGDLDGDLFHRHLVSQVDGDHLLAHRPAGGVYVRREGVVEGDGEGGAVHQLHQGGAGLDGPRSVGAGDLDLAHHHAGDLIEHDGQFQRIVHRAVPVEVAQGEGAVAGAHDHVLAVAVQRHSAAEGFIAVSGEGQLILRPSGGKAGQHHLVVAHLAFVGQLHAVGVLHGDGDVRIQSVYRFLPAGEGDGGGFPISADLELDIPGRRVGGGLGQVEADGQPDGSGGGCAGAGGVRRDRQARQAQGAHQDQAEQPGNQSLC